MVRYRQKASLVNSVRLTPHADGGEDLALCPAVHVRLSLPARGPLCAHVERFQSTNRRNWFSAMKQALAAGFVAVEWFDLLLNDFIGRQNNGI